VTGPAAAPGAAIHHPFPAERFLPYLTTTDIAALPKEEALVVLPIASIEQHGPHLPVASDTILGHTIIGRALERLDAADQVWVLPGLAYGKSNEHRTFAGTMTLEQATLAAVLHDLAASVARAGFRRLVLANAHGGNPAVVEHVARDAHEATGLIVFPLFLFRMNVDYGAFEPDEDHWGTHAGEWETSALLAVAPELVHRDRTAELGGYPSYARPLSHIALRGPITYAWLTHEISPAGNLGDPRRATLETGEAIMERTVARLVEILREMATFEMPTPPARPGEVP
jgi:creatinine amidohydrolase/Fe(II)-dependent formamide hydrolase-like protein